MSDYKLRITAQYQENYAFDDEGYPNEKEPFWKNKGGAEFHVMVSCNERYEFGLELDEFAKWVCEKKSNSVVNYIYIGHEFAEWTQDVTKEYELWIQEQRA